MIKNETALGIKGTELTAGFYGGAVSLSEISSDCHYHDNCEIYINISGDVSFRVEDKVYGIKSGDVIITKPYEKHHCIYHSICEHDHFCMNFSAVENSGILGIFFDRKQGEGNLIRLASHKIELLMAHCKALVSDDDILSKHVAFYSILALLSKEKFSQTYKNMPADVKIAMDYIGENFASEITVKMLSALAHVTENTLTRHFNASIGMSPYEYIRNLRFSYSVALLEKGMSVTEAAVSSGFSDYSHFISAFKKRYGKTPLQLQKEMK